MEEHTDEALMTEVAQGNLDLLRILFERHHVHIFNFLYQMSHDRMLSEDLTQETFYKLMKYRSSYNNGKFVSWLFTIARNTLKTHYTREKEKFRDLEGLEHQLTESAEDKNENLSKLAMAIEKLGQSDKELLVLNRLQEIKYHELAEILNSTPGAIKTKVSRALKKLKAIYFENIEL
ncbi:MAG: RNA polymerase sigma factor [Bacteroidota bacterium]